MNKFFDPFNLSQLKQVLQKGSGNIYVIAILGTIVAGSALMTGGLVPKLDPPTQDAKVVEIDPDVGAARENSALELKTFGILTPTLEPTDTQPTVPVPTEEVCINNTAILTLVDISQSMQDDGKIRQLRAALREVRDNMRPETALGIYGFGSYDALSYGSTKGVKQILNFTKLKGTGKGRITTAINEIVPGGLGGTYVKNGFKVATSRINSLKNTTAYKDYRFITIVFSDGVPERSGNDNTAPNDLLLPCAPERITSTGTYQKCWYNRQDPRRYGNSINDLQAAVESTGGRVYSVVVYDNRSGSDDSYFLSPVDPNDRLRILLKETASKSSYYYNLDIGSVDQLAGKFKDIITGVCQEN